jgi:hypothetical protein
MRGGGCVTLPAFQILREWLQQHPDATVWLRSRTLRR